MRATRRLAKIEVRIVGALMEKEQTTPAGYPMTVNALRGACNQKTNRDPVTDLGEGAVRDALESLRKDVLVWRSAGARVEHWEHRVTGRWGLNKRSKAVMTLLMLRGAQTPGELRTRSERMAHFDTVDEVVGVLHELAEGEHPMVRELTRAPGQRESRWCHLMGVESVADLGDAPPRTSLGTKPRTTAGIAPERPPSTPSAVQEDLVPDTHCRESDYSDAGHAPDSDRGAAAQRIAALEDQVADLDERLKALEKELL